MKNKIFLYKTLPIVIMSIALMLAFVTYNIKKDFRMTRAVLEDNLIYFSKLHHMDYEKGSLLDFYKNRCDKADQKNMTDEYDTLVDSCTRAFVIQNLKKLYASNSSLFEHMKLYEKECNKGSLDSCRFFSTLVYFSNDDKLKKYIKHTNRSFDITSNIHSVTIYNPFSYDSSDVIPSILSGCIKGKLEFLGYKFTSPQKCTVSPYQAEIFPLIKKDIY